MPRFRSFGRSLRLTALLSLAGAVGACAHTPVVHKTDESRAELERLRIMLTEREQVIEQLHGKVALLEAGQRSLADQLAERERESAAPRLCEEPAPREPSPRAAPRVQSEARPLLRLHGDSMEAPARSRHESPEYTSTWQPPRTSERLTVAPVPALGSSAPAARADDRDGAAEALYVQALDLVRKREFGAALRELDAFMRAFPEDARAVRVQFWRGEVLFAQREYPRALAAFEDVLERDPRGDRAADALLRVARCQKRMGAADRARSTIAELRDRFPESEAARAAAQLEQEDT